MQLRIFVFPGGKAPQIGKFGDAGLDVFSRDHCDVKQFDVAKIPLGFAYSFFHDGAALPTSDFWLEIKNRSGVGTKSGFVTVAEVGDSNYRGEIHYCVAKVSPGVYMVQPGDKIAQALIHPFIDPYKIQILRVATIEELGPSPRGADGFGSSGNN
jgi:dUTPase